MLRILLSLVCILNLEGEEISEEMARLVEASTEPRPSTSSSFVEDAEKHLEQGFVAKDFEGWIKGFSKVELVVYDHIVERGKPLVDSGRLHKGIVANKTVRLSDDEIQKLLSLVTGENRPRLGAMCYEPHHGFIFYDSAGKVVGHLEICLMCNGYYSYPRKGLSRWWDLDGLEKLIKDKGLPAYRSMNEWKAFFEESK